MCWITQNDNAVLCCAVRCGTVLCCALVPCRSDDVAEQLECPLASKTAASTAAASATADGPAPVKKVRLCSGCSSSPQPGGPAVIAREGYAIPPADDSAARDYIDGLSASQPPTKQAEPTGSLSSHNASKQQPGDTPSDKPLMLPGASPSSAASSPSSLQQQPIPQPDPASSQPGWPSGPGQCGVPCTVGLRARQLFRQQFRHWNSPCRQSQLQHCCG